MFTTRLARSWWTVSRVEEVQDMASKPECYMERRNLKMVLEALPERAKTRLNWLIWSYDDNTERWRDSRLYGQLQGFLEAVMTCGVVSDDIVREALLEI